MLIFHFLKASTLFVLLTGMVFFSKTTYAESSVPKCIGFFQRTTHQRSLEFSDVEEQLQRLNFSVDQNRYIVPVFSWDKSPASVIMTRLMNDWNVSFLLHDGLISGDLMTSFPTIHSQKTDILISSARFNDPESLTNSLYQIEIQFRKLQRLSDFGVYVKDITVSSKGLEFVITKIRPSATDPSLRWIRRAMERFGIEVVFTNEEIEKDLIQNAGFAIDKTAYLRSERVLPVTENTFMHSKDRSVLAHELVHAFRSWMHEIGKTTLFWFSTTSEDSVLSERLPISYQESFRTDEFEGWKMSHHFTKDRKELRDLFLIQIPWLKEAQELLQNSDFVVPIKNKNSKTTEIQILLKESDVFLTFFLPNSVWESRDLRIHLLDVVSKRIRKLENWQPAQRTFNFDKVPF